VRGGDCEAAPYSIWENAGEFSDSAPAHFGLLRLAFSVLKSAPPRLHSAF